MSETDGDEDQNPDDLKEVLAGVAQRIKAFRTAANLSQARLGILAQLRPAQVFELETGKANMTLKTMVRVATALNVTVSDLIPQTGESLTPQSMEYVGDTFDRVRRALEARAAEDAARPAQNAELLKAMDVLEGFKSTLAKAMPVNGEISGWLGYSPRGVLATEEDGQASLREESVKAV